MRGKITGREWMCGKELMRGLPRPIREGWQVCNDVPPEVWVSLLRRTTYNRHIVAILKTLYTVKLLLQYKTDVDLQDNIRWASLMIAGQDGHIDTVELLLEYKKGVNLQDNIRWASL